jgi:uncharacterized protein YbjT (DUF2867 family)
MKKDAKQTHDAARRNFLRTSAATGLGAAVAAALPGAAAAAEAAPEPEEGKGYRLTRHVLDYYKTLAS